MTDRATGVPDPVPSVEARAAPDEESMRRLELALAGVALLAAVLLAVLR
jgi:hypothetical protein